MRTMKKIIGLLVFAIVLSGCQQMEPTSYGLRFRKLPPILGGGVAEQVVRPGEVAVLMPWDSLYTFDAKPHDVSWGSSSRSNSEDIEDFVYSRARDGNEVALAFTIRYRVSPEPENLRALIQRGALNDDGVRELVITVGRSDVRRYMNELHTSEFLDTASRYKAVDKIKSSMQKRLKLFGIEVVQVNMDDYRFERKLRDGTVDASYQQRLTEIQQLTEDTERERSRTETVRAKKAQERNAMEASVAQVLAGAEGYLNQAKLRGDGYFQSRGNEAQAILAQGQAAAQGITEQAAALQGSGGQAILKLEIAKQLQKNSPAFVTLNDGAGGNSLDVRRLDTNALIAAMGVMEGVKQESSNKSTANTVENRDVEANNSATTSTDDSQSSGAINSKVTTKGSSTKSMPAKK